jgi:predicted GIY-YIG superfamily endonuclease
MLKFKFYYFGHIQISENVSGIYAIVNTLNNKKYIGSSENLRKRYRQHFNNLNKNKHVNTHLQRAYNKYGASVFEFWILEECENIRDTLITKECRHDCKCEHCDPNMILVHLKLNHLYLHKLEYYSKYLFHLSL